jgi:hypothetical protein
LFNKQRTQQSKGMWEKKIGYEKSAQVEKRGNKEEGIRKERASKGAKGREIG